MFALNDLYRSPNKLAALYKNFNVGNRLLLTGHSHQAWPDVAFEGQMQALADAALYADLKWENAFQKADEVRQGFSCILDDENGLIALAQNTHDLLIRFLSALPLKSKPKLITTEGEFHTIRRQLDRLAEEGIEIIKINASESNTAGKLAEAIDENTSAVLVSAVMFKTGRIISGLDELAAFCREKNVELLIDAYHALNVIEFSVKKLNLHNVFIVGGGYKYCQLGEGNCFMRFPGDCSLRPVITGWFGEFTELASAKKENEVFYGNGPERFAGSTYDPTSHYRAAKVFGFFQENELSPAFLRKISKHQTQLIVNLFDSYNFDPHIITRDYNLMAEDRAGFVVFKSDKAGEICNQLKNKGLLTDYRDDSLRFGPAPYLSDSQITEAMIILKDVVKKL